MLKIIKLLALFFGVLAAQAQSITATGGWSYTFGTVTEAGSNLSTTAIASTTSQTVIGFSGMSGNSYIVRVHKSDIDWNASLVLSIQRTSNGSGGGGGNSISGGTTSFALTGSPQVYFSGNPGNGTRTGINNQYRITGQTVLIPAKTYTANVVYTISAN